jgi:cytochrome c oxidase subunit 2
VITAITVFLFVGKFWWFPVPISAHGLAYDHQFQNTLVWVGLIFVLAQLVLGLAVWRFRGKGSGRAAYFHGNNKLEFLWTTATLVLFVTLVASSERIWAAVHLAKAPDNALKIEVLSKQFAWSFRYPGPDGKFGRTDIRQINDANGNPFGIDDKDPAGKDDIVSATLHVPAGTPIRLTLKSRDVIHSFFVRELRLKQDLVPGMEIPLYFQADKIGSYELACAELCGLGHHQMRSSLEVMSPADFEKWLRQAAQQ